MYLKHLRLQNFRNHLDLSLEFHPRVNLITGDNGIGKTNILEAIHLISTGKSFRTSCFDEMIHHTCSFFFIEAEFVKENIHQTIKIGYEKKQKYIELNATKLMSFSNLLGILPSVLFAPKDINLIMGFPADRRRFLNIYLSQIDPLYVHYLQRYTKCLEQRNALLKTKKALDILEMRCFEKELSLAWSYLLKSRLKGVEKLSELLQKHLQHLTQVYEPFQIKYIPSASITHDDPEHLCQIFEKIRPKEKLLGVTLAGPHREDFGIYLNNQPVKSFCSEGQKRSFLTALKLAEWDVLSLSHPSLPLFCLDDLGIHLDEKRLCFLEKKLSHLGQVFISSPKNTLHATQSAHMKAFDLANLLQVL